MQAFLVAILVGMLGGMAIGFQNPLASVVGRHLGVLESIFVVHVGGALAAGLPLLLLRGGNLSAWRTTPWYALGAGVLGLAVIGSVSYTIPRLGAAATVALLVAAQLSIGLLLDHFGFLEVTARSLDPSRVLGVAFLLGGTWLLVR